MRKFWKLGLAACIASVMSATIGFASTVTHLYESTADLSTFGGSATEDLSITYTFDPDAAPDAVINSKFGGVFARYGGITGVANVGSDRLTFSNADIYVYSDWGLRSFDAQQLRIRPADGADLQGTVFGEMLVTLEFYLAYIGPLPNTDIITDLSFLNGYDEHQNVVSATASIFGDFSGAARITEVSAVPLPGTLPFLLAGLLGVLAAGRRRA